MKANTVTLSRKELARDLGPSDRTVERAVTLPGYCYTSDEFFEFEREAIFEHGWVAAGHVSQLRNAGDYLSVEVAGEPILLVRDQDGTIRALSNVCQHRGTILAEGRGNCGPTIRCPYHSWNYALDGRLRGAPYMSRTPDFDTGEVRLPAFPVEIWNGFAFVSLEAPSDPPASRSKRASTLFEISTMGELVGPPPQVHELDWNWKIMLENAAECYHCTTLHGDLHKTAPTRNAVSSPLDYEDNVFVTRVKNTAPDTDFNPTEHVLLPVIPTLSEDDRSHSTWVIVPPNLFLSLQHDNAHYFVVSPHGAESTTLEVGYLYPRSTIEREDFEEKFQQAMEAWEPILEQDVFINRRVQKGLHSRHAPRGRYSWQEETLVNFNRWLVSRYQSALVETAAQGGHNGSS